MARSAGWATSRPRSESAVAPPAESTERPRASLPPRRCLLAPSWAADACAAGRSRMSSVHGK
eukprot:9918893-Alexandrium_andersonii.AAC.1